MDDPVILGLNAVGVLAAFLLGIIWIRIRTKNTERLHPDTQIPSTPFDVSSIAPQIGRVRQNHLENAPRRADDSFYRRHLLSVTRPIIASLSYFRSERPKPGENLHRPISSTEASPELNSRW